MTKFFGTDGIRGVVNKDLTLELAFDVGFALGKYGKKFVIGKDTRKSGQKLATFFCDGIISGGGEIIDVGIIPTPGISFLTKALGCDFGVMITASHNPKEYNGIKIFDKNGEKISKEFEDELEKSILSGKKSKKHKMGKYVFNTQKTNIYRDFIIKNCKNSLKGLNVLLDCANGASFKIAPEVFCALGADIECLYCDDNGDLINENCGALYAKNLSIKAKKYDITFTFDGDADRVVPVYKDGQIIDGDRILLILLKYYRLFENFDDKQVVATIMSNLALEEELKKEGVLLLRTDVGDKNITQALKKFNLKLGAEQSGHIILMEYCPTGDGIMCAVKLCEVLLNAPQIFEYVMNLKFYPQILKNVKTDKSILDKPEFLEFLSKCKRKIGSDGRVLVRPSGTEPLIRLMVEHKAEEQAKGIIKKIETKLVELKNT